MASGQYFSDKMLPHTCTAAENTLFKVIAKDSLTRTYVTHTFSFNTFSLRQNPFNIPSTRARKSLKTTMRETVKMKRLQLTNQENSKRIKNTISTKQPVSLLPEIINEILSRLPIKSLTRLISVSKSWSIEISDPRFIKRNSERVTQNPNFIFTNPAFSHELLFYDIEKDQKMMLRSDVVKDIGCCWDEDVELLYSCDGLLLLHGFHEASDSFRYFVVNPVTKQSASVPKITGVNWDQILVWIIFHAMAFDSVSSKYKIVFCGYDEIEKRGICKTISVGEQEWRDMEFPGSNDFPSHYKLRSESPVYANGALHFMIDTEDEHVIESITKILTLDVGKEVFSIISHPRCELGFRTLLESNGLLHYIDYVSETEMKVWVLKDLEKNVWEEMWRVNFGDLLSLPFPGCYPFALLMNSNCKIIIGPEDYCDKVGLDDAWVYTYDVKMKKLEYVRGIYCSWNKHRKKFRFKYVSSLASF